MAITKTARTGQEVYGAGSDPHPSRVKTNENTNLLDRIMALAEQGITTARPTAGKYGRFYWDTSVARLYWDDGTAWQEVSTNGGGGAGKPVVPAATAIEGVSTRSARADHTHTLALATAAVHGAMASTDKAKLDAATAAATANTLVMLDAAGRAKVANPSAVTDMANKQYVDGQVSTSAPLAHVHSGADITTGTISDARIANATAALDGLLNKADKAKLDAASMAATAGVLAIRDTNGNLNAATPTVAGHAATKGYVDGLAGNYATAEHTHSWAEVTGKPTTFAPSTHTHTWAQVTGVPSTFAPSAHTHSGADITTGTISDARIANATAALDGLLNKADKAKLDAASMAATAGVLAIRDTNGNLNAATPTVAGHAATKGYVDGLAGNYATAEHTHSWAEVTGKPTTFAPSTHTHTWAQVTGVPSTFTPSAHTHSGADITSGTISDARIANATTLLDGLLNKADKAKLDAATPSPTPSTLMMTDTAGRTQVAAPAAAADAANKGYVDGKTWDGSDISTGLINQARIANATASLNGLMSAGDKAKLDASSPSLVSGVIAMRDSNGNVNVATPTSTSHATNKSYVDSKVSNVTVGWGDVSDKPVLVSLTYADSNYAPKTHLHDWNQIYNTDRIYNTNAATGSYRAVWVNSAGVVGHNLSSEKYKTNIHDYVVPLDLLDTVTPKRWNYKTDVAELGDAAPERVNFIAEDLHDAGLTEYVSYDGKGTERENVETINEQLVVNALWSFAKQHNTMLADIEQRLIAGGL